MKMMEKSGSVAAQAGGCGREENVRGVVWPTLERSGRWSRFDPLPRRLGPLDCSSRETSRLTTERACLVAARRVRLKIARAESR